MSGKISNNSLKLNCEQTQWVKTASLDTTIKLAGEEAKDRLYEPKQKKLVRVLTVVAYVFFVSLAAIMLSLYYVFLWKGYPKEIRNATAVELPRCKDKNDKGLDQLTELYDTYTTSVITPTEDNLIDDVNEEEDSMSIDSIDLKNNLFYKKYLHKKLILP